MKWILFIGLLIMSGCQDKPIQLRTYTHVSKGAILPSLASIWIENAKVDERVVWQGGEHVWDEGLSQKEFIYHGFTFKVDVNVSTVLSQKKRDSKQIELNINTNLNQINQEIQKKLGNDYEKFVLTIVPSKPVILLCEIRLLGSNQKEKVELLFNTPKKGAAKLKSMDYQSFMAASDLKSRQKESKEDVELLAKIQAVRIRNINSNVEYSGRDLLEGSVIWGWNYSRMEPPLYGGLEVLENPYNLDLEGMSSRSVHDQSITIYDEGGKERKQFSIDLKKSDITYDEYLRR